MILINNKKVQTSHLSRVRICFPSYMAFLKGKEGGVRRKKNEGQTNYMLFTLTTQHLLKN